MKFSLPMRATDLFKHYRKSINPPYKGRDYLVVLATVLILVAIPATVLLAFKGVNLGGRAAVISKIWLEGENGQLTAPMTAGNDTNASGGKYVSSTITNTAQGESPTKVLQATSGNSFLDTFDGTPAAPESMYRRQNWSMDVNSDNFGTEGHIMAQHGSDCGPPPATHMVDMRENMMFNCRNHIMTSAGGFENFPVVVMTPAALLDWSQGEATFSWRMSTERGSDREWPAVVLTPGYQSGHRDFDRTLMYPFFDDQGPPSESLGIEMLGNGLWNLKVFNGGVNVLHNRTSGWNSFLTPSATRRDLFVMKMSRTHLSLCMPEYNHCFFNDDIPALSWTNATVQFMQLAYNSGKGSCIDDPCEPMHENTWHIDDVSLSPAIPFTVIHSCLEQRDNTCRANSIFKDPSLSATVNFERPSPPNSYLRFAKVDKIPQYALDVEGFNTWHTPTLQQATKTYLGTVMVPIPEGVKEVRFRNIWPTFFDVHIWSTATPLGPACSDTIDNDSDGKIDFPADPGCTSASDIDEKDPPETIPPTVNFISPANGATVSDTINVEASASDASGIALVEFYVDGIIHSFPAASPYKFTLDTAELFDGSHTLMAQAFDKLGNKNSANITISTSNSNPPLPTNTGSSTIQFSVPEAGSYNIWTRMLAANASSDSFWLRVDTKPGIIVGNGGVTFGSYQWVDHKDGNTSSKISLNLTEGTHTLNIIGREAGAKIDKVLVTNDTGFIPTGMAGDLGPPSVSIISPLDNGLARGQVDVSVSATDDSVVSKVELLVDGSPIKETDTQTNGIFTISWDSTSVTNGDHTLTAKATDGSGNSSTSSAVKVEVDNPPQKVIVDFNTITVSSGNPPLSGQHPSGLIDWGTGNWVLSGPFDKFNSNSISFNGASLTQASFTILKTAIFDSIDADNGGGSSSTVTLKCSGNPDKQVSVPSKTISIIETGWITPCTNVTVMSSNGWDTNFDNLVLTVSSGGTTPPPGDTTNPTVSITSPANGATVSSTVNVAATTSDNVGVTKVEFFIDNASTATCTDTTSTYTCSIDTTKLTNGSHTLKAKASDAAGMNATASVTVTVSNVSPPPSGDSAKPTVSITSPASGATVSKTVIVSAAASDNVGVAKVEFFIDGKPVGSDTTSSYTYSWDTTKYTNAKHTLQAKAYDAATNQGVSSILTVTTSNTGVRKGKIGDLDGDGKVNIFDLSFLLSKWGTTDQASNLDGRGRVDIFDLSILLSNWGS
ncbi:MAG: Ig-like domain-containing protein [Candidatus Woykebacteria bacterium]